MDYFLLDGTIRSYDKAGEQSQGATQTQTGEIPAQAPQGQPSPAGGFGIMGMVVYFAIIIAAFYFLAIRPQKKREKQLKQLQDDIKLGDWVLIDSGMYGKVAGISDGVYTIEFGTNKGVLIPVLKSRIVSKGQPSFDTEVKE